METQPVIEAQQLGYIYTDPTVMALSDITFSVKRGCFLAVMGPNGSGKSTLAKLMVGLMAPTEGVLRVMGQPPWEHRAGVQQSIGYVPQHETVNEDLPVRGWDIVAWAAASRRVALGKAPLAQRVRSALEMVKMAELSNQRFSALSGGQRQRVLMARALAVDPRLLVLDEPFAGVDAPTRELLVELLTRLAREKRITVIMVVHNVNPVAHSIDQVLLLNNRMVAFGAPETVLTEDNLRAAYGTSVPILVCEEGRLHPMIEATAHERDS